MTIDYYNQNAEKFCSDTLNVDMTGIYEHFLPRLARSAHILDAGCGSGRDAKAFRDKGYQVTAFDASLEMVTRTRHLVAGCPVLHMAFEQLDFVNAFDGIWACASLLHVPQRCFQDVLGRCLRSLRVGGIWYLSCKLGTGERVHEGRLFNDQDEESLSATLSVLNAVEIVEMWRTADVRPWREDQWLNCVVKKTAPSAEAGCRLGSVA